MIVTGLVHAGTLARIHAACFEAGEAWNEASMRDLLAMPGCFACLAEAGGLAIARVAADEAELLSIAVPPPERGRGVGRALLAEAVGQARAMGAARMYLEVAPGNGAALALYAAAGFAASGRRRAYYSDGSDALLLSACVSRPA